MCLDRYGRGSDQCVHIEEGFRDTPIQIQDEDPNPLLQDGFRLCCQYVLS